MIGMTWRGFAYDLIVAIDVFERYSKGFVRKPGASNCLITYYSLTPSIVELCLPSSFGILYA